MFTVICNKCGSKDIFISGGYDGDYMFSCQKCDNAGSDMDGTLTINAGTFDPTPVQTDTDISQEDAREMADMLAKMNAQMKSTNDNLSQMINKLEVIKDE